MFNFHLHFYDSAAILVYNTEPAQGVFEMFEEHTRRKRNLYQDGAKSFQFY
jgi:hypothetical protein